MSLKRSACDTDSDGSTEGSDLSFSDVSSNASTSTNGAMTELVPTNSLFKSKKIKVEDHKPTTCNLAIVKDEPAILDHDSASMVTKSMEDLKKSLKSVIMVHSVNSGDFSTGGLLSDLDLPNFPLINVKDYGILPTPITKLNFDSINLCYQNMASYKLREDKSIQNGIELESKLFEITNERFGSCVSQLIEERIKPELGLNGNTIKGKLCKLILCEPGNNFDECLSIVKDDNMFGILTIQLPSIFTGGDLVVSHNKNDKTYKNNQIGSSSYCTFVAHYSSCPHTLQEITSGYRVALVYSLCWNGMGMKPSPYIASTNTVKLCNLLNQYMDSAKILYAAWALDGEVDTSCKSAKEVPQLLEGTDKLIYSGLINALAYDKLQYDKDRYQLYIATATWHIKEEGTCGVDTDSEEYRQGGRWNEDDEYDEYECEGDCDAEFNKLIEQSFKLTDFVPLTEASATIKTELNFKPYQDVLNYIHDNHGNSSDKSEGHDTDSVKEFWGSADLNAIECEGPKASRERSYTKEILVLWRSDNALTILCQSDISDGVSHVLKLIRRKKNEDGMKGLAHVWQFIDKVVLQKDIRNLINICACLKRTDYVLVLMGKMQKWGIVSEKSGETIANSVEISNSADVNNAMIELLKKCKKGQIQNVLYCCNLLPAIARPQVVIEILAEYIFKPNKSGKYIEVAIMIEYMFQKNLFPEKGLTDILNSLTSLSSFCSLIPLVIVKNGVNAEMVTNKLVVHFAKLASGKTLQELGNKTQVITQMITFLHSKQEVKLTDLILDDILPVITQSPIMIKFIRTHMSANKEEKLVLRRLMHRFIELIRNSTVKCDDLSKINRGKVLEIVNELREHQDNEILNILINGILSITDCTELQTLLRDIVSHVTPADKENLPDCLMKVCRARVTHLEGVALKGKPPFSWHQPDAIVPSHPRVQEFLRGPRENMVYKNFLGLRQAKSWSQHYRASGCYMKVIPGSRTGKNASVEVIKTREGYEKIFSVFKQEMIEYKRLVTVVPGWSDATLGEETISNYTPTAKFHDVITLD